MQQLGWHNLQNWVSLYWTHGSCPLITSCSRDRCSTISTWAAHHDSWALLLFSFSLIYLWSLSKTIILLVRFFIMLHTSLLHVALYRTDMIWYIYIYIYICCSLYLMHEREGLYIYPPQSLFWLIDILLNLSRGLCFVVCSICRWDVHNSAVIV